ncbi:hypothetical protein BFG52_04690 [Acinetobacter larvae]|uniref:Uncharacterized protein n=1 Tax=Acinetobacter larvae TaxID=1789224 RepID=A0A1B2LY74_9GAMM|nr:hypothetical protein BFG52_04690 [Acinetobacter larvae]
MDNSIELVIDFNKSNNFTDINFMYIFLFMNKSIDSCLNNKPSKVPISARATSNDPNDKFIQNTAAQQNTKFLRYSEMLLTLKKRIPYNVPYSLIVRIVSSK